MIRAVLDSNVLISAALEMESGAGAPAEILRRLERHEFTLMLSVAIIDEITRVCGAKPSLQRRLSAGIVRQYLLDLVLIAEMVAVNEIIPGVAPHPHDDPILAAVAASNADWFVTGDRRLRAMHEYAGVPFTDPNGFLAVLDAQQR